MHSRRPAAVATLLLLALAVSLQQTAARTVTQEELVGTRRLCATCVKKTIKTSTGAIQGAIPIGATWSIPASPPKSIFYQTVVAIIMLCAHTVYARGLQGVTEILKHRPASDWIMIISYTIASGSFDNHLG